MAQSDSSVRIHIYDDPKRDKHRSGQRDLSSDQRVKRSGKESEFVYVNQAYTGSVSNLSDGGYRVQPPTTVIREQYWACSRWPAMQKTLVLSVGILLGLVVGLAVWVAMANQDSPLIADIFTRSHPAPD